MPRLQPFLNFHDYLKCRLKCIPLCQKHPLPELTHNKSYRKSYHCVKISVTERRKNEYPGVFSHNVVELSTSSVPLQKSIKSLQALHEGFRGKETGDKKERVTQSNTDEYEGADPPSPATRLHRER